MPTHKIQSDPMSYHGVRKQFYTYIRNMKPEQLTSLTLEAERQYGRALKTPTDFEAFAAAMKPMISPSTLKRIWGYNTDYTEISMTSADTLARHCGYKDYDDFIKTTSLGSDEQRAVYAASQIAVWSESVHSDRFSKAYELFLDHKYAEAQELFSDDKINAEMKVLCRDLAPFIENTRALVSELIVKAHITWACDWQNSEIITAVDAIYNQALPLAEAINDHNLLWNIYQDWAFKYSQLGEFEKAFELYHDALRQGKILQLETPDEYPVFWVSSVNDIAMLLNNAERYDEGIEQLEAVFEYANDTLVDAYVCLNYAKALLCTDHIEKAKEYYGQVTRIAKTVLDADTNNHEAVHILGLAHYNLGVIAEETDNDTSLAIRYYNETLAIFGNNAIPNLIHQSVYNECGARLARLATDSV